MSILQTVDLKKDYGEEPNITHALNGIQFEVDKGEFVGIMGASGSGKTCRRRVRRETQKLAFAGRFG